MTSTPVVIPALFRHRNDCPGADVYERQGQRERVMTCRGCQRTQPLSIPELDHGQWKDNPATPPPPRGRFLLTCCRCSGPIWLHRPEPRVPVCQSCKGKPLRQPKYAEEGMTA